MKQIITIKSDECHEVEIREVTRGSILQGNLILCRVSVKTSHYLKR